MYFYNGKIAKFPFISVDNFGPNTDALCFFLSHKHMDHMYGLDSDEFYIKISDLIKLNKFNNLHLFCSEITKKLLYNDEKFTHISNYFCALVLNKPFLINPLKINSYKRKHCVYNFKAKFIPFLVTPLPANHCPGSVMFLFENPYSKVLYSGDFRFGKEFLKIPNHIYSSYYTHFKIPGYKTNQTKGLDYLYLDMTFASPQSSYIPSREDSCSALIELIKQWFGGKCKHSSPLVRINLIYDIGYEPIYEAINKAFGKLIHVSPYQIEYYRNTVIFDWLTLDSNCTPFHACRSRPSNTNSTIFQERQNECDPTQNVEERAFKLDLNMDLCADLPKLSSVEFNRRVLVIQPSAMWYNSDLIRHNKKLYAGCGNFYRLCFCMHSSYAEVLKFAQLLQPSRIIPIAQPRGYDAKAHQHFMERVRDGDELFPHDDFSGGDNDFKNDGQLSMSFSQEDCTSKVAHNRLQSTFKRYSHELNQRLQINKRIKTTRPISHSFATKSILPFSKYFDYSDPSDYEKTLIESHCNFKCKKMSFEH